MHLACRYNRVIKRSIAPLLMAATIITACTGNATPTVSPEPTSSPGNKIPIEQTNEPSPAPEATSLPSGLIQVPVPDFALETAGFLDLAAYPPHDYYRAAVEILGMSPDELVPDLSSAPALVVNARQNFFYNANLGGEYRTVPARLRHISDSAAWWTGVTTNITDDAILTAAGRFEELVLPTNRLVFGKEWSPGIDNDPLIHFLVLEEESWGGFFGYFSRVNQFPTAIEPISNQKEMLVLNASAFALDSETFPGKLAHEYQHLIQWNQDQNEDLWLNEAFSELAYFLSGSPTIRSAFGPTNAELFALNTDIQLTARPERKFGELDMSTFIHYGAERAFIVYLFEQFGPKFIQDLVKNPEPGVLSIRQELSKLPDTPQFDDVFANFTLAGLLNQRGLAGGIWGYKEYVPFLPERDVISTFNGTPIATKQVPYSARYYEIHSDNTVNVSFTGSTLARLTPVDPASGMYAWYSNRGDSSAFTLTRAFDLSGLNSATLNYKIWYELEEFYDFAYLEISTDGGAHWTILETAHGTSNDPNNQAYGFAYTGAVLEWKSESIDISEYAGQEILVRFEVITDFHTNRDGIQLDNIEIPELGYFDGAEDDSGGWQAEGFIRSSNFVPVNWIVWLVETSRPTRVTRIELDDLSHATFTIEGFGTSFPFAAIVVSPAAPVTTMDIPYELVFKHP